MNYAQLTPVLIEAIKELAAQNEALKARNAIQTTRLDQQQASLLTLHAQMARLLGETPPAVAQARK